MDWAGILVMVVLLTAKGTDMANPNPDLAIGPDARPRWNSSAHRRHGFHNLHRIARYVHSFRAAAVLPLTLEADLAIAARDDVARLTASPWFSAMVVARGDKVLYEKYAPDFPPDQPHSIMSISKTTMQLEIGRLWSAGLLSLDEKLGDILPWAGAGYAGARLQDVLDMNVSNAYSEDYSDPMTQAFLHEAATGMRLPPASEPEVSVQTFLSGIGFAEGTTDTVNRSGQAMYKSANTDMLAAVAQVKGGRSVSAILTDIADAAGLEGALHVATDRSGFASTNGGICLTARDLARYGLLIARRGVGVGGEIVGSADFIARTLAGGVPMPAPRTHLRYSNQTNTNGRWLGHGGYGGQYMLVDLQTGTTAVFLSVLQDRDGYDAAYYPPIIAMLESIACG